MRNAHGTYRFGPFRLDADARQLFRDGTRVYLQDRCFDVLALLVANPGDILSQDDLTKAVWTDYNVTDNSIVQTVGVLRDVLAGRPSEPHSKSEPGGGKERGRRKREAAGRKHETACPKRETAPRKKDMSYIQTMHRKGYRFIQHVEHEEPAAPHAWRGNARDRNAVLERHSTFLDGRAAIETLELAAVDRAYDAFTELVRLYPDMPEVHIGMANASWLRHESTRALPTPDWDVLALADRHANEAYRLRPSSGHALGTLAIVSFSLGKWREAIAAAREAIARQPEEWRHFLRLAHVSWGADRLAAAYEVLSLYPCLALAHWYAATVFIARGAFDRALEHLRAACAAQDAQRKEGAPFSAIGSHLVHGLTLDACGRPVEAREELLRELALDARQVYSRECLSNAWCALGALALRANNSNDACEAFRQARCLIPGHALAGVGLDDQSLAPDSEHARNNVNSAIVRAAWLSLRGHHDDAARICGESLVQSPPGFSGWILPIEPLVHVSAHKRAWTQTLAALRDRAS